MVICKMKAGLYDIDSGKKVYTSIRSNYCIAALTAPLVASRFISAALPLPLKYEYTCCITTPTNCKRQFWRYGLEQKKF